MSTPPGTGMNCPSDAVATALWNAGGSAADRGSYAMGSHAERAPCLAEGDADAQRAASVAALHGHDVAASVDHDDRQREHALLASGGDRLGGRWPWPARA
jgi:hypothetical protein